MTYFILVGVVPELVLHILGVGEGVVGNEIHGGGRLHRDMFTCVEGQIRRRRPEIYSRIGSCDAIVRAIELGLPDLLAANP
jgi:hypothetical protein